MSRRSLGVCAMTLPAFPVPECPLMTMASHCSNQHKHQACISRGFPYMPPRPSPSWPTPQVYAHMGGPMTINPSNNKHTNASAACQVHMHWCV